MANKYTVEQVEWLNKNRPLFSEIELSNAFHLVFDVIISPSALAQFCLKRGFKPPKTNSGRFKKGNVPFNFGVKGNRVAPQTEFKKGHKPHNYLPVGHVRFSKGYWHVKVSDSHKWRAKHNLVWEKHHGKEIPKSHVVIFLDSNIENFDPDNLQLISRKELLQLCRNKYKQAPKDLKPSVLAISKLEAKIYEVRSHI